MGIDFLKFLQCRGVTCISNVLDCQVFSYALSLLTVLQAPCIGHRSGHKLQHSNFGPHRSQTKSTGKPGFMARIPALVINQTSWSGLPHWSWTRHHGLDSNSGDELGITAWITSLVMNQASWRGTQLWWWTKCHGLDSSSGDEPGIMGQIITLVMNQVSWPRFQHWLLTRHHGLDSNCGDEPGIMAWFTTGD